MSSETSLELGLVLRTEARWSVGADAQATPQRLTAAPPAAGGRASRYRKRKEARHCEPRRVPPRSKVETAAPRPATRPRRRGGTTTASHFQSDGFCGRSDKAARPSPERNLSARLGEQRLGSPHQYDRDVRSVLQP